MDQRDALLDTTIVDDMPPPEENVGDSPPETVTVRQTTLSAWQQLQEEGHACPSVRQVYDRVGGSYTRLAAELKLLRQQAPMADTWFVTPETRAQADEALAAGASNAAAVMAGALV